MCSALAAPLPDARVWVEGTGEKLRGAMTGSSGGFRWARDVRVRVLAVVCVVLALAAAVAAGCSSSSDQPGDLGSQPGQDASAPVDPCADSPTMEGCGCTQAGESAACGKVVQRNGGYVTCSMGYAVCDGHVWGPCAGDTVVMKSIPGVTLTTTGDTLKIDTVMVPCTNLCDPNGCASQQGSPSDIDSGAISISDGGVSILPTLNNPDGGTGDGASTSCTGLQCNLVNCTDGGSTTITGTVYDPAGLNPLYNAYVYVPLNPDAGLPAFTTGPTCDTCAGVNISAISTAQTGPDGTFTLTNVPAGSNIPLVIQMGKWRRQTTLSTVSACQNNPLTVANTRLPRNQTDGDNGHADIPKMAFVSGSADPFECFLLKTGLDPAEFGSTTKNSTRRILYFNGSSNAGASISSSYGNVVYANDGTNGVYATPAELDNYDVVLLACEGGEYDKSSGTPNAYTNMINYANSGGKVFATHYGYVWPLYSAWDVTAPWYPKYHNEIDTQDPMLASIVTSGFPKGQAFSQWLQIVNASQVPGQLDINEGREDLGQVTASYPNTQPWMTAVDTNNNGNTYTPTLTFNTPYPGTGGAGADAGPGACGRVVYTDFHVSSGALVSGGTSCSNANDCGFTATCNGSTIGTCSSESCNEPSDCNDPVGVTCSGATLGSCSAETCATVADCADPSGVTCSGATLGTCTPETCYKASQCQGPSGVTCSGSVGTCSPKTCSANGQCSTNVCSGGQCTCNSSSDCRNGETCSGPNGAKHCSGGAACSSTSGNCGGSEQCNGRVLGACTKTCSTSADCFNGEYCAGGVCSQCLNSAGCPGASTVCTGGSAGTCTKTCAADTDCYNNGSTGQEHCVGGVCKGCGNSNDCPGSTSCSGQSSGTCKKTCATQDDCFEGETCVGGVCSGCAQNSDCPSGSCNGGHAGTCSASGGSFPLVCRQGPLSAQEKALEFLFFDLTACVSPDNLPPPPPPPPTLVYNPVTFTLDFDSSCPSGTHPEWRELDWQDIIPPTDASTGASIVFQAQTVDPNDAGVADFTGAQAVTIATATQTTPNIATGNYNLAYIDTGPTGDGGFDTANPPIASREYLQITVTLDPSSDRQTTPTLVSWKVQYDCAPAE